MVIIYARDGQELTEIDSVSTIEEAEALIKEWTTEDQRHIAEGADPSDYWDGYTYEEEPEEPETFCEPGEEYLPGETWQQHEYRMLGDIHPNDF